MQMLRLIASVLLLSLVAGSRCPDQQRCGEEQTCCQIRSGEFNCCPFHQGECCEDHLHCCPEGMLCEMKKSSCTNATHSISWAERFPSEHSRIVQSYRMITSYDANNMYNTVCPDNSFCPWEFSCLKVSETYGCCPEAQGIVCSDGKHCCPSDRECTTDSTSCVEKTVSDVLCDDTAACPDGSTCCKDGLGGWGCCPLPQAVCCEDFIYCCPQGKKCNHETQSCDDPSGSVPWLKKVPSRPIDGQKFPETKLSDVPCDDTVGCPDGTTCCKDGKGGWGCCPLPQAVCCEDFTHCCPQGKKCNLAAQTCDDPFGSVPWLKKVPSRPIDGQKVPESKLSDVPCDDTVACPDGTTCCKDGKGGFGCCPFPQAVCCEDFTHCCPQGKKCNLAAQTCDDPFGSVPWLKKVPSRPIDGQKVPESKLSDVPCDDTVACPDGTTCCKDGKGGFGCCPFPQAVCCEDFIHCCPQGKKCNLAAQTCDDPFGSVPWLKKVPSRPIDGQKVPESKLSDVPCDDTVACPDGTTCCKDGKGGFGCCPFPQAVCCEDFIHCCPQGKKCNLAAQTCDDPFGSVPWLKKVPSRPIDGQKVPESKLSDVPCDDTVACPDGTTCCKDGKGGFGCCPFPQAVCCEDFTHCCPQGKKCNLAAQTCDDPFGSVPWLKKVPSRSIDGQKVPESKFSDVPCDDTVACPDGTTCCKDGKGGFGCCPIPQAVCCEDFTHCCPHGKKCNLAAQTCDDPFGSVPWLKKVPSRPIDGQKVPESKISDVPCDDTVACPDGTTCCKDGKGGFGCCPFPQAVCCEDFIHCCPQGKKCNLAAQTCDDPFGSVPWLKKVPSRPIDGQKVPESKLSDVPCDDTVACPDGTTCCKDGKGGFGCCPFPQAVCCEDFTHCCPQGKKCNLAAQTCDDPYDLVPWLKKVASRPIDGLKVPESKLSDVSCDDTVACPDGTTCCKDVKGGWGCCPFPEATCCEDGENCCPKGYVCRDQWCEKSSRIKFDSGKREMLSPQVQKNIDCGEGFRCRDTETCCRMSESSWGCCPFLKREPLCFTLTTPQTMGLLASPTSVPDFTNTCS
ncbi:granulin-a isoform X1 [Silurus meridionalis]|nr:granulin-a isoform X1 [Silurus meridionalis]